MMKLNFNISLNECKSKLENQAKNLAKNYEEKLK